MASKAVEHIFRLVPVVTPITLSERVRTPPHAGDRGLASDLCIAPHLLRASKARAKRPSGPPTTLGIAVVALVGCNLVAACTDYERFQGRTTDQVKQACDPQRHTPEECARTLDR